MNLRKRILSAVVLIVLMLACVFLSPVTRILFFAAASILCAWEWSRRMEALELRCTLWILVLHTLLQGAFFLLGLPLFANCACFIGCIYLTFFLGIVNSRVSGKGALGTVAGLAYPGALFTAIMAVCVSDIWLETLALACLATWSCDNAAFLVGSRFGKHKLAPAVSPHKTVEGALAGALFSLAGGLLAYLLGILCKSVPRLGELYSLLPLWLCLLTALIASTLGQIGDLAESLVKRMIGVKDFSDLIPGHGGMFDRADSLLFAIPTACLCLRLAGV